MESGKIVSILILLDYLFLLIFELIELNTCVWFQSLFYWITYSYKSGHKDCSSFFFKLFQSLFYWITYSYMYKENIMNTIKNGVSILILLDYLFLWLPYYVWAIFPQSFNPYFIGLPILIRSVEKALYLLLLQNFFQTLKSSFFRFF